MSKPVFFSEQPHMTTLCPAKVIQDVKQAFSSEMRIEKTSHDPNFLSKTILQVGVGKHGQSENDYISIWTRFWRTTGSYFGYFGRSYFGYGQLFDAH